MAVPAPASEAPRLGTPLTAKLARSLSLSPEETALLADLQARAPRAARGDPVMAVLLRSGDVCRAPDRSRAAFGGRAGRAFPARNPDPVAGHRARRGTLLFDAADARSHRRHPRALRGACEPKP